MEAVRVMGEESIEYTTFVLSKEPTLDVNLGLKFNRIGGKVCKPLTVFINDSLLSIYYIVFSKYSNTEITY